ncbi:hypothetical protein BDQ17DRAFT_326064 [Cyathus striatus]|nr:hypothetical protein BDQ17DRAFT_326064 [Cyathus striatus]
MTHPLDIPSTGENTVSPTPAGYMSPPEVFGSFSPPESFISIEPLLASSVSPGSTNPPPLSLPSSLGAAGVSGDGLGDIAEGAEEEEEETETAAPTSSNSNNKSPDTPDDSEFISPSQIKGLKISTSPFPATGTPILSPTSPVPQFLAQGPGSVLTPAPPPSLPMSAPSSALKAQPISPPCVLLFKPSTPRAEAGRPQATRRVTQATTATRRTIPLQIVRLATPCFQATLLGWLWDLH